MTSFVILRRTASGCPFLLASVHALPRAEGTDLLVNDNIQKSLYLKLEDIGGQFWIQFYFKDFVIRLTY